MREHRFDTGKGRPAGAYGRTGDRRTIGSPGGPGLLPSLVFVLGGLCISATATAQDSAPPRLPPVREVPAAFSEELNTVENDALDKLRERDLRRISLREASLFHRKLVRTLDGELPRGVTIRNDGPLATEGLRQPICLDGFTFGGGGIRRETEDLSGALSWSIDGTLGIFSFWISTARTNSTVAVCDVEGSTLFLNVDWIADFRSVDEKLPELGGRSVREILVLVEQACARKPQDGKVEPSTDAPQTPADPGGKLQRTGRTSDFSDLHKLIELIEEETSEKVQPAWAESAPDSTSR